MRPPRAPLRLALAALLTLLPAVSAAQGAGVINEARLVLLFESYLESGRSNTYLEKQIGAEREKIRAIIDGGLASTVAALTRTGSGTSLSQTLERQRSLVSSLRTQRDETNVDLDLLEEEEQYYLDPASLSGAVIARLSQSHPELLAKRLILEERSEALEAVLETQRERLRKLGVQLRIDQAAAFMGIGKYFLLIFAFVLAERFVRLSFLARIQNRNRRYAAMKLFTAAMYMVLTALVLAQLAADHPGFLTSFAIVGAGIAIALQDVIKDIFGWMVIVQKRMFGLGQRITVGPYTGDIIDISPLRTTILEANHDSIRDVARIGQTLYVPNSIFLREPVLNFHSTSDFIEAEIRLAVSPQGSWQEADRILREILHEETDQFTERARRQSVSRTQHFFVSQDARGARVFMEISSKGVLFTLRFLVPIGERRLTISKLTGIILERFAKADPPILIVYDAAAAL